MASVNGLSLKAITNFKDHEGCTIAQGNLYLGSKKIGFWSQDSWGGPDMIDLEKDYDERKLYEWFKERNENIEIALWNLLELKEDEKEFKKWKCDRMFKATDGYHVITLGIKNPETTKADILNRDDIWKCIDENFYKNKELKVDILDKDSFDVGEKISIGDIMR